MLHLEHDLQEESDQHRSAIICIIWCLQGDMDIPMFATPNLRRTFRSLCSCFVLGIPRSPKSGIPSIYDWIIHFYIQLDNNHGFRGGSYRSISTDPIILHHPLKMHMNPPTSAVHLAEGAQPPLSQGTTQSLSVPLLPSLGSGGRKISLRRSCRGPEPDVRHRPRPSGQTTTRGPPVALGLSTGRSSET